MNLQQHHDLIGQILKERPELASLTVKGYSDSLELKNITNTIIVLTDCDTMLVTNATYPEDKQVWQHQ